MFDILLLASEGAGEAASHAAPEHSEVMPESVMQALFPAITSLVVFLIAFGILARTVWPKITQALDEREQKILSEIKAAEEARDKATAAQEEYERSLADAQAEAREMIAGARADAKKTADEMLARNQVELGELKQRATHDIELAKQGALRELHAEASVLASAIAGKILQREISADDQQRLVEESLAELGRTQN